MDSNRTFAYLLLCIMPFCFSTNLVFGRATVPVVEPWTLASLRWSLAFLLLLPFCWHSIGEHGNTFRSNWLLLGVLGFLGMWICGGVVYFALRHTSATNGTLIYTTTPVIIILLEWYFRGRAITFREVAGVILAVAGVFAIVIEGSFRQLTELNFNLGDLLIVLSAISFAVYSVLLKRSEFSSVPTLTVFAMVCLAGAVCLFPFAMLEIFLTRSFPTGQFEWTNIAGIVLVSSILAFFTYQIGVKMVGPSITGLFMYLLPAYGVGLSVLILGEKLELYHILGSVMIMSGLILATFPVDIIRKRSQKQPTV